VRIIGIVCDKVDWEDKTKGLEMKL